MGKEPDMVTSFTLINGPIFLFLSFFNLLKKNLLLTFP